MELVEGRAAAPQPALVLDVVVDQERVVEQLDGHGGAEGLLDRAAEGLAAREHERRPDALAGPRRVVTREAPEARIDGVDGGQVALHLPARQRRVAVERALHIHGRRRRHR